VAFARLRGDWETMVDEVRAGLAALADLRASGDEIGEEDADEARRAFRYARGLLAGDELEAWLEGRGVGFEDWNDYLERQLARARMRDGSSSSSVRDDEVEGCLWAEAVCSGLLEETADTFARMLAACPGVPLEGLEEAFDTFCRQAATVELITREIEVNQLEWLRLVYERTDFEDEDAALEAALCVRNDGDSLSDVAARAGVPLEECSEWLDELPQELVPPFLAARPGGVVGPVRTGDVFRLALLREKNAPSLEDEDVKARASAAVIDRAVEREANDRVAWIERL